uniref:VWFA domain-containing protein n=1 Tax=Sphenodon punctatus TaxID=8508 RepID=A0A8D0GST8_SPHPU
PVGAMGALTIFLGIPFAALVPCHGFSVDVEQPVTFQEPTDSFGQSVALLIVGAPLQRGAVNEIGKIYKCSPSSGQCQEISIQSRGLPTLPATLLACGPTVHQACGKNLYMKGYCFLLDQNLQQLQKIPETLPECPSLDIVFLIDGSGSINSGDFRTMKTFISEVMKRFRNTDTQFALWQFSDRFKEHFNFNQFQTLRNPDDLLRGVSQLSGLTHTATAIQKVVPGMHVLALHTKFVFSFCVSRKELFVPSKGSRHNAAKVLIVVTDGEKYGDPMSYQEATAEADKAGIIRYAIGVGNAFSSSVAKQELNDIASNPNHVFQVNDFNALRGIQDKLQEKIFAIEGTQSQNSSSFQLEMSQEGFSALLSPDSFVLGAVGAYDWSGGIFLNGISRTPTFLNASSANTDMKDAYLGYSVEAFSVQRKSGYVVGAPRYQHVGKVIVFTQDPRSGEWEPSGEPPQIGSYFGATLCAVDLDRDTNTDLILIGAPMYHSEGAGGRVYVCPLASHRELSSCNTVLQGQTGQLLGRFGTSMAQMGDISGDRWTDVVIGAPLESDNQGAVYVFQGTQRSINPQYSQRIVGSQFPSGLRFFGQAVSGGTDLTGDGLTDVAVGAQGQVLLLRSRPVLQATISVSFTPSMISTSVFNCQGQEQQNQKASSARVCFTVVKGTKDMLGDGIRSTLRYTLTLDPGRPKSRAAFNSNSPSESKEIQIGIEMKCETFQIILPVSPGLRHHLSGLGHHLSGLGDCSISSLRRQQPLEFTIKGNVSFAWLSQTQQQKVTLLSTAKIEYNQAKYTQKEGQGSWIASPLQVQTVVERIEVYNYLPMIIGASVGGLILLALITAALYKLGFFKRQYKQMMEKPVDEDTGGDGASQTCNTPNQ